MNYLIHDVDEVSQCGQCQDKGLDNHQRDKNLLDSPNLLQRPES